MSARLLPVLALLGTFAAAPAAAAVLVSNVGQTESGTGTLGATHAQGFTTGSYAAGYVLTSIEIHIKTTSVGDWPKMRAELWSDNNNEPGARLARLTAPSTADTGVIAFSAQQGTRLTANTVYHFVIYSNDATATTITITNTNSNSEDAGAATGWSIANGSHWSSGHSPTSSTTWTTFSGERRIRVNGSVPSSNANLSGLTASSGTSAQGPFSSLTLTPASFSAAMTSYTATVANSVTHVKLTPTVQDTGKATVTVDDTPVVSGSVSAAIALSEGANAITVRVTAQDSTTKDYTVTVTRQAAQVPPTVSLSALPNLVDEGSSVTVTATLSRALSSNVTIPLTLTDDTAEPDDHGPLASITIVANSTSGTGTITTNQDPDTDNETFTVALDTLPSSVTAGTPNSVQITIRDDDEFVLSVDATPSCGATVTDTSVEPSYVLELTPASDTEVSIQRRVVADSNSTWLSALPIVASTGRSIRGHNAPFSRLRNAYPGFRGFEFRLANDHSVTVQCTWTFTENPVPPPPSTDGSGDPGDDDPGGGPPTDTGSHPTGGGPASSSDATLRALTGRTSPDGSTFSGPLALSPAFAAATMAYTATVPYGTTHARLTPTANHDAATVQVGRQGGPMTTVSSASAPLVLRVGETVLTVEVTAQDRTTTQTYTVTVTREAASTDARLRTLTGRTSPDGTTFSGMLSLSPVFAPATEAYTATVGYETTQTRLTPTVNHAAATVTVNGVGVASGQASTPLALRVGETVLTVVGTAEDGTTRPYTVTITRLRDPRLARLALAQDVLAPQVIRAMTAGTLEAVTTRLEGTPPTASPSVRLGGASTLAQALYTHAPAVAQGNLDLRHLLAGSGFTLPLRLADTGPFRQLVLWGSGDYRNLSGGEALRYTGAVVSGHVGAELTPRTALRTGVALSWAQGALDYTEAQARGTYERTLTTITPYVGWTSPGGVALWATAGYGWGEVALADAAALTLTRDLRQQAVAGGVRGPLVASPTLVPGGTTRLTVHGETAWTWATVKAGGGLAERTTRVNRQRLRLEGQHERLLADGGTLTPSVEMGLRHDGGTGETGASFETGGGLRYTHPGTRLTLATQGRVLLAHRRAYEEWGVSGLVQLAPSATGEGLAFRLAPAWGVTGSGVDRVWATNTTARAGSPAAVAQPGGRVELVLGYGLRVPAVGGLVTPFTGVAVADQGLAQTRVGLRVNGLHTSAGALGVEVIGEHRETPWGQPDQRIGVQVQLHWGRDGSRLPIETGRAPAEPARVGRAPALPDRVVVVPPARARPPVVAHSRTAPRNATTAEVRDPSSGGRRYFVQLGAFSKHANAVRARTTLAGALWGGLRQHARRLAVVASPNGGLTRVLVPHAFSTRRAAAAFCAALTTRGPACAVIVGRPKPGRVPRRLQVAEARSRK